MELVKKRNIFLILVMLLLCFILSGCDSVQLSEKTIKGVESKISVSLPRDPKEIPLPGLTLDSMTQRYLRGQRFYGELNEGLQIAIYTNTVDSAQMYTDLGIESGGQQVNDFLANMVERASGAILNSIDAENVSTQQSATTVSGEHAVVQTFSFSAQGKNMKAKLLGFSHEGSTWIILVAYDADSKNAGAVDKIIQSVRIL